VEPDAPDDQIREFISRGIGFDGKALRRVIKREYTPENGGGWAETLECGHVEFRRGGAVAWGRVVGSRVCFDCTRSLWLEKGYPKNLPKGRR
jgi:hypothetical protein